MSNQAATNRPPKAVLKFHWTARWLHWGIVLAVALLYATAYYRKFYTTQLESSNWYLLVAHMNIGVFILVLTLLAILLRLFIPKPVDPTLPRWKRRLANVIQFSLTTLLLLLPIAAYFGTGLQIPLFNVYFLPSFAQWPNINEWTSQVFGMPLITFLDPFAMFHKDWGPDYVMPLLLLLHIPAALYHHFVIKDYTLKRMW